jgi:hypothetical protein
MSSSWASLVNVKNLVKKIVEVAYIFNCIYVVNVFGLLRDACKVASKGCHNSLFYSRIKNFMIYLLYRHGI